jgi:hypothetical protein
VRSRHGLTFLPRADLATPGLDRLLVPGAAAAATRPVALPAAGGPTPEYVRNRPGFASDATIRDLARTTDVATAGWTAKVHELPTAGLVLDGPAWPWAPTALLAVVALLGASALAEATRLLRRRSPATTTGDLAERTDPCRSIGSAHGDDVGRPGADQLATRAVGAHDSTHPGVPTKEVQR